MVPFRFTGTVKLMDAPSLAVGTNSDPLNVKPPPRRLADTPSSIPELSPGSGPSKSSTAGTLSVASQVLPCAHLSTGLTQSEVPDCAVKPDPETSKEALVASVRVAVPEIAIEAAALGSAAARNAINP